MGGDGLRVLVDARLLYGTGIGRYIRDGVKAYLSVNQEGTVTLLGDLAEIEQFRGEVPHISARINACPYEVGLYSVREQLQGSLRFAQWAGQYNVVHFPHYNAPWVLPSNSIVTVHDLIPFTFPQGAERSIRARVGWRVLSNSVMKAKIVLCVSETTGQELVRHIPEVSDKVRVLSPYIGDEFQPSDAAGVSALRAKFGLKRYLLFVGNRKPHKNIRVVVEAFRQLPAECSDLQLVIVGRRFAAEDVLNQATMDSMASSLVVMEGLTDVELRAAYSGSEALIMPSLVEGFGYPPLEAQACGTPVIASDIPVFRETLGDSVAYFDPSSPSSLVEVILDLLNKSERWKSKQATRRGSSKTEFGTRIGRIYQEIFVGTRTRV